MAKIYDSVYACFRRPDFNDEKTATGNEAETKTPPNNVSDNAAEPQPGLLRRTSGGLLALTTGVIGTGFGTVKWVASTTYGVGSGVVNKIRRTDNSKDKKD